MLLNNSHIELHTVCFMHGLSIYEIKKDMSPCSIFHNLILKFSTFDQFFLTIERITNHLLFQTVTRYCMIYFGNFTKIGFVFFRVNYILKILTLKILFFSFHGLSFYLLGKRKEIGSHIPEGQI